MAEELMAIQINEENLTVEEIIQLISELKEKCKTHNLDIYDECNIEGGEIDINISIQIPSGGKFRELWITTDKELKEICNSNFENYKFLENYQAIWSKSESKIEAIIQGVNSRGTILPARRMLIAINICSPDDINNFTEYELEPLQEFNQKIKIKIKRPSDEINSLCEIVSERHLVLEISNIDLETHDKSLEILNKVSNAIFFELDFIKNLTFQVAREIKFNRRIQKNKNNLTIALPRNAYDQEPMALYWYARRAVNMPLLQYLAYYQAIEFYYPIFHNAELSRKLKNFLRDPTFRYENDTDIVKLISLLRGKGNGVASERDQLKATLKECITAEDLKSFIESDEDRKKVLSSKLKNITSHTIHTTQNEDGLINSLMERLYSIRCKIVHIKADDKADDIKLLLPFSKEEESIQHDIELIQYIAQKILVHCSKPFTAL